MAFQLLMYIAPYLSNGIVRLAVSKAFSKFINVPQPHSPLSIDWPIDSVIKLSQVVEHYSPKPN